MSALNDNRLVKSANSIKSDVKIIYLVHYSNPTGSDSDTGDNIKRRSIEEVPAPFHHVFSKFRTFNIMQSQLFDDVFYSGKMNFDAIIVSSLIFLKALFGSIDPSIDFDFHSSNMAVTKN